MDHKFINQINPGQTVDGIYMVTGPILRSTSKGDPYIAMYLSDRTGRANGRMWQASEAIYRSLPKPGFVEIQGRSELYQDNLQIIVNAVKPVDSDTVEIDVFLPRTDKDIAAMFDDLSQIVRTIRNPHLKAITEAFLADEKLMEKFRKSPAAMKIHHSYIGGLLEHTHNILKAAVAILPCYPQMDADLVLAGIFLHDMGKTEELSYDMAFAYTDRGQLIGHVVQGVLMITSRASDLAAGGTEIDTAVLNCLEHIVLSHHGQYEFGSPKLPAMSEAFLVCYLDDLDAKINQVNAAIDENNNQSDWTDFNRNLQTKLYRKKI